MPMRNLVVLLLLQCIDCAPKLGPMLFDPLLFEASKVFGGKAPNIQSDITIKPSPPEQFNVQRGALDTSEEFLENNDKSSSNNQNTPNIDDTTEPSLTRTTASEETFTLLAILRRDFNGIPKKNMSQIQRSGYDFNPDNCKQIRNRILCGYDKNTGTIDAAEPPTAVEIGDRCRVRGDRIECGYLQPPFENFPFPPKSQPLNDDIKAKYVLRDVNSNTTDVTEQESVEITTDIPVTEMKLETEKYDPKKTNKTKHHEMKVLRQSNATQRDKIESATSDDSKSTFGESLESDERNKYNDKRSSSETSSSEETTTTTHKPTRTKKTKNKKNRHIAKKDKDLLEILTGNGPLEREEILTGHGPIEIDRRANDDVSTLRAVDVESTTNSLSMVTRCVEKNDRIVCYPIKGGLRLGEEPSACYTCG